MLTWKFEAFVHIHRKMILLSIFSKICQKCIYLANIFKSPNIKYLLLLMSVTCANGNNAVTNYVYTIVHFTKNGLLKMLHRHFWYFNCSNFKTTFEKKNFEKKLSFFNFFQIPTMAQNFVFCQSLAVKWLPRKPF